MALSQVMWAAFPRGAEGPVAHLGHLWSHSCDLRGHTRSHEPQRTPRKPGDCGRPAQAVPRGATLSTAPSSDCVLWYRGNFIRISRSRSSRFHHSGKERGAQTGVCVCVRLVQESLLSAPLRLRLSFDAVFLTQACFPELVGLKGGSVCGSPGDRSHSLEAAEALSGKPSRYGCRKCQQGRVGEQTVSPCAVAVP